MKIVDVFEMLKPYNNDRLSLLNKKDLYYLKYCLKHCFLELRESLALNNDITFGVEFEVDNINDKIYYLRRNKIFNDWIWENDDTLIFGKEVVSPVLKDDFLTWDTIEYILMKLSECSEITHFCGGHIHFGTQILGTNRRFYYNLYLLWQAYENIIYRFGYGEYIAERARMNEFAKPFLSKTDYKDCDCFFSELSSCMGLSYGKLTENKINEYKKSEFGKTIEVRSPNASLNPIIWQNNINFFAKLILYAKSDKFNYELVFKRINRLRDNFNGKVFDYFRLIDYESAIELADLIFDNNLDKVYFLRQYIKDDEVGMKILEKGTKFTKILSY